MSFSLQSASPSPPPMTVLSVGELMSHINNAVRVSVGSIWVEGEIGDIKTPSSGHVYLTLKDAQAQISCVFFRFRAIACPVELKVGVKIRAFGEVAVYEKRGQVQLNLIKVELAGQGELQMRFLALKNKLEQEGLFDAARKKPIAAYPRAIGLVTSPSGAAIQDIRHILEERAPWVRVYLLPVPVQGSGAEYQIASAIRAWGNAPHNGLPAIDTLIVARGGGSLEDLWNFNEEVVARAIVACPVPVICGVGHEIDFTIADFAADMRAPTPTAAAVLATPDGPALLRKLASTQHSLLGRAKIALSHAQLSLEAISRSRLGRPEDLLASFSQIVDDYDEELKTAMQNALSSRANLLDSLEVKIRARHPRVLLQHQLEQLEGLRDKLQTVIRHRFSDWNAVVSLLESRIHAASPENTLKRGYALIRNQEGHLLRDPDQASAGDVLQITVERGQFKAQKL